MEKSLPVNIAINIHEGLINIHEELEYNFDSALMNLTIIMARIPPAMFPISFNELGLGRGNYLQDFSALL